MMSTYQTPWCLTEMGLDTAGEPWEIFEYPCNRASDIFKPVPNWQAMERQGWNEMKTLRRLTAPNVMQTLWFKKRHLNIST